MSNIINSRKISDLHPFVMNLCKQHIVNCAKRGVKIIVTDVMRSDDYQAYLHEQGRSRKGNIVTWTKTTYAHGMYDYNGQFKSMAYDVAPMTDDGKSTDYGNRDKWKIIIEVGKALGLEHGTEVFGKQDDPHWQLVQGITKTQLKSGKRPSYWSQPIPQTTPQVSTTKPQTPQKPINTISPFQKLHNAKIISDLTFWQSNAQKGRLVDCNSVKWLFRNFYKYMTKVDGDYLTSVNYCLNAKVISDKSYWIDSCNRGQTTANGEYVEIVIKNMANKLK